MFEMVGILSHFAPVYTPRQSNGDRISARRDLLTSHALAAWTWLLPVKLQRHLYTYCVHRETVPYSGRIK